MRTKYLITDEKANLAAMTKETTSKETSSFDAELQGKVKRLIDAQLKQIEGLEDSEKWKHE